MRNPLRRVVRSILNRYILARQKYFQDYIFIHINKTGGSSVERALGGLLEHKTAREKRAELGPERWQRRFKFSFVRNPWDKVASHYHYRAQRGHTGLGESEISFPEWVRLAYGEKDPRYYNNPPMFMPQSDWLTDEDGEILVDFVGRFERLAEDFAVVCERLGRDASLPHLKASRRGDYREDYDDESREVVARCFREDLERFAYRFDPSD